MKTKTLIAISAVLFGWAAGHDAGISAVIIVLIGHAVIFQLHAVEVKINRLLDHSGIYVSRKEIDE